MDDCLLEGPWDSDRCNGRAGIVVASGPVCWRVCGMKTLALARSTASRGICWPIRLDAEGTATRSSGR